MIARKVRYIGDLLRENRLLENLYHLTNQQHIRESMVFLSNTKDPRNKRKLLLNLKWLRNLRGHLVLQVSIGSYRTEEKWLVLEVDAIWFLELIKKWQKAVLQNVLMLLWWMLIDNKKLVSFSTWGASIKSWWMSSVGLVTGFWRWLKKKISFSDFYYEVYVLLSIKSFVSCGLFLYFIDLLLEFFGVSQVLVADSVKVFVKFIDQRDWGGNVELSDVGIRDIAEDFYYGSETVSMSYYKHFFAWFYCWNNRIVPIWKNPIDCCLQTLGYDFSTSVVGRRLGSISL